MKKRLQAIIDWIEPHDRIIDIGSDHLIIPNHLIDQGITSLVFASDINDGPLQSMKQSRQDRNIIILRSDGLKDVDHELDGAIIAGMGGRLIQRILEESLERFKHMKYIIVQPMQQIEELRQYLQDHFTITAERLVSEDGKIYHVIKLISGQDDYDVFLTKGLAPKQELSQYYAHQLQHWRRLLPRVSAERRSQIEQRIARLERANML